MNFKSSVIGMGLFAAACGAATGAETTANEAGQTPPAETQAEPVCIAEDTNYQMRGKTPIFIIDVTNACEKRMKCTINAYVVGAKGPTTGEKTMILGPKSNGTDAKQTFAMKVKQIGGMATVSHQCKAI